MGKMRLPLQVRRLDECGFRLPPTINIALFSLIVNIFDREISASFNGIYLD